MANEKRCSKCAEIKPLDEFHRRSDGRGTDGRWSQCKVCVRSAARTRYRARSAEERLEWNRRYYETSGAAYYQANKERIRERHQSWQENNRTKSRSYTRKWREANREHRTNYIRGVKYGLTPEAWRSLLEFQDGSCALCRTKSPGTQWWHTDHDHAHCGRSKACARCIRGLLCQVCNNRLGHVEKWFVVGMCAPSGDLRSYLANPPWRRLLATVDAAAVLLGAHCEGGVPSQSET